VEDSFIGLSAAKAAGMRCMVTKSSYTQEENFAAADRVVDSLDNPTVTLADMETLASR
jgi:beta-phosphoglucomutase-like phosphatase (HAD superfamily)